MGENPYESPDDSQSRRSPVAPVTIGGLLGVIAGLVVALFLGIHLIAWPIVTAFLMMLCGAIVGASIGLGIRRLLD